MRCLILSLLWISAAVLPVPAEVHTFRLDQEQLWFGADQEQLTTLLENFAVAGVRVQIDPSVEGVVSGSWSGENVEEVLDQLISPYDYLLDWQREAGPLGNRITLTGIRVFRKGYSEAVRPLRAVRRIETALNGSRFLAREILIGFGPDSTMDDLRLFLARTGGTVIESNSALGIYRILLPEGVNIPELAEQFSNDENIALAEPNYIYDLPGLLPGSTAASGASKPWTAPSGDGAIAVAVLDSGLVFDENLSEAVLSAFDALNPDAPLTADAIGHGTLMAKLAAGVVDPYNTQVGEGVPVVAIKAFADDGSADSYTLMSAMTHAVANSDGPVSLSWGSETPSQFVEHAVQYAIENGSPVFAAVGNENTGRMMYPAAYPGVIGVAASDGDQLASYSNRGDFVDIIAPGSAGGSQGTSISTAYVSHIAAKYMRANPEASASQAMDALLRAAGPDRFLSADDVARLLAK